MIFTLLKCNKKITTNYKKNDLQISYSQLKPAQLYYKTCYVFEHDFATYSIIAKNNYRKSF